MDKRNSKGQFVKGLVPFNKRDWTDIDKAIAESYPMKGRHLAKEIGISVNMLHLRASALRIRFCGVRKQTEQHKQNIAAGMRMVKKDEKWKANLAKSLKGRPHSPERVNAIVNGLTKSRRKPVALTKPERFVDNILNHMCAPYKPFKFTGHRNFWIALPNGKMKNPDFTAPELNKVIEVFGRYWHRGEDPADLIAAYKAVGWECLVLWEDDDLCRDVLYEFAYPYEYAAEFRAYP